MKYSFILNKTFHEWSKQAIAESELRKIGNIPAKQQLFLKVQGADELITVDNPVDLGRLGIEQIYSIAEEKYQFIINERLYVSHEPFIKETELRLIGKVPPDDDLYFKKEGKDHKLLSGEVIDLKPYPIEEFYSVSQPKLVTIKIDNQPYPVKPGEYKVEQIREIGNVKPTFMFEQLIDNKLVKLEPGAVVTIKGGEEFKSFAKDGSSS